MAPITLYGFNSTNSWKVSILLEELGLEYDFKNVDILKGVQKEDWYTAINPNGRIPALVDNAAGGQRVFESGAILWYLAEKEDKEGRFWPKDFGKRAEVMSWLMFQMGGVGPMQGQANWFVRLAPEKIAYPMNRYINETKRLYGVMDAQLAKHAYLTGDQYTIADIACFAWVVISPFCGVDFREFASLSAWVDRISERPAVKKGLAVPGPSRYPEGEAYAEMLAASRELVAQAEAAAAAQK